MHQLGSSEDIRLREHSSVEVAVGKPATLERDRVKPRITEIAIVKGRPSEICPVEHTSRKADVPEHARAEAHGTKLQRRLPSPTESDSIVEVCPAREFV